MLVLAPGTFWLTCYTFIAAISYSSVIISRLFLYAFRIAKTFRLKKIIWLLALWTIWFRSSTNYATRITFMAFWWIRYGKIWFWTAFYTIIKLTNGIGIGIIAIVTNLYTLTLNLAEIESWISNKINWISCKKTINDVNNHFFKYLSQSSQIYFEGDVAEK